MREDKFWMSLVAGTLVLLALIGFIGVQGYHERAEASEVPSLDAERDRGIQEMKDSIARMERDMNSIQLSVFRMRLSLLERKFEECGCYDGSVNDAFNDEGRPGWTVHNEEE
jgi:hypothetical protein